MTARRACVHAHFYQPPRENPWTGRVPGEPSASPWPNWNVRITDECYEPNARLENYAGISFNVGPTLMAWLASERPDVHDAIVSADAAGAGRHAGRGGAIAQGHDHVILPLATARDRRTQVAWGVADFRHRFGREPDGLWLPETAVDLATLETLAEAGIRFTVLAPRQARRVRAPGGDWRAAAELDTGRAYRQRLPSGREIALFFYDGALAHDVAFGGLLHDGATLAGRLTASALGGAAPRLAHFATDGETFGHHHRHGEMALAWALDALGADGDAPPTNLAAWLADYPPEDDVEIVERTSWSCAHGVRRWAGGCGCGIGGEAGDHRWRAPLRRSLARFAAGLADRFEREAVDVLTDPWAARDGAAVLWLDAPDARERWMASHLRQDASPDAAHRWMAEQRAAMRMFTSCGWFFDDPSGLETRQVLRYAGLALDLAGGVSRTGSPQGPLAGPLLDGLAGVRSHRLPGWDAAAELRRILREDRPEGFSPTGA